VYVCADETHEQEQAQVWEINPHSCGPPPQNGACNSQQRPGCSSGGRRDAPFTLARPRHLWENPSLRVADRSPSLLFLGLQSGFWAALKECCATQTQTHTRKRKHTHTWRARRHAPYRTYFHAICLDTGFSGVGAFACPCFLSFFLSFDKIR
jgi:hypothetical protein